MRRSRTSSIAVALAVLCAVAFGCTGCIFGSPASITASAEFSDVGNLVPGAPVQMAGITVGTVKSISLSPGSKAKVVLSIQKSARVPASVMAQAEQSTVLGEEVVELTRPSASAGTASVSSASGTLLANGAVIHRASLVPGIEQFVSSGTAVLGSIGTSQLAALIDAGGQGFGGQAQELRNLISNLNTVMNGYSTRSGEIRQLITNMNGLSASLASHAGANAQALTNLSKTVTVLDDQSGRFLSLLKGLNSLSTQGRSLLTTDLQQIDTQLRGLAGVTGTVNGEQRALATFLEQLPGHDSALRSVTVNRFVQVIDAIIVCGLPDGGSTSQAASSCHGAGALKP